MPSPDGAVPRTTATPVDPATFADRVRTRLGDDASTVEVRFGHVWVTAPADRLRVVGEVLKSAPDLACGYFSYLAAVDWEDEGCELLVNVMSLEFRNTVIVKVRVPWSEARFPSLTPVWRGANWHEREAAEMFGLVFDDHPNLVKLYLPEDFEGHPMRRRFRVATRVMKPWPGAKDEGERGGPPR